MERRKIKTSAVIKSTCKSHLQFQEMGKFNIFEVNLRTNENISKLIAASV